ncbi:hypothetical protein Tco_0528909 [Tanacetum coccineum]
MYTISNLENIVPSGAVSTACYDLNRSENQANKHAGPKEANHNAGTEDNIDAGDSEIEAEIYSGLLVKNLTNISGFKAIDKEDQVFLDELERLKRQEQDAYDAAEASQEGVYPRYRGFAYSSRASKAKQYKHNNTASNNPKNAAISRSRKFWICKIPSGSKQMEQNGFTEIIRMKEVVVVRNKARIKPLDLFSLCVLHGIHRVTDGCEKCLPVWTKLRGGECVSTSRSMIGSLMYLTASRPDIMFAVCACSRFQVTPKTSHLSAVKRIFRYLKGKPKLGLWYPRVSSFDLEAYSDSDYAGANLDRKSTTGGCQFLGRRLISWQCKKQTIVATSTTEAEYVAAANCCGQVLWIQNQMLDYGFNFMNTKIYIDNESTICIVKNPVYHSKTKHIAIRHHFIRDAYEKKLIQVLKIHTDDNVADLLTKAFDVSRFQFLVHNMVAYLEKTEGNAEFHEMSAKSKIIKNVRYITAKVVGKPVSISKASIRSDLLFDDADGIDSLPNQAIFDAIQLMGYEGDLTVLTFNKALFSPQWSEANVEPQSDQSPRPSPTPHFPDFILEVSGRNHGGQSSSDKSLSGNDGDMTDLFSHGVRAERRYKLEARNQEKCTSSTTPTPTPTTFGDDETIAQVLLNMSQAKAVSKEKEKGRYEESDTKSEEITEAKKKFDQIAHDEEVARKIQEEWEAEEEIKRFDDSFIAIGSAKDERKIKEMNKGASDPDKKKKFVKEDVSTKVHAKQDVAEQGIKKRKGGHMKMIARKRKRPQPDVDRKIKHRMCP